ncbi:hypothetical protein HPO_18852 [Hyphomonas polymorpha PS728]|uniref:Uncharacterized protein n=1 Tax=Hyphomonas polymorpha PS728 TaxID=1280954 RepID=A0A062VBF7_9PROT|nr:hypothetical protein [Hyphomonas polymorpha]KCZ96654.1 hypothetical protein HPO_18852 [Hyphomonas polymorpha PS728]
MTEQNQTKDDDDTPLEYLALLPIDFSMNPPEDVNVESVCIALSTHPDVFVRGNAMIGFGHLARVTRKLNKARVKPILEAALHDMEPSVRGKADDAMDDIENYLGWKFERVELPPLPAAPDYIRTKAAYRVYLVMDEESNILVERYDLPGVIAPSDKFDPDPRGLSHGYEWRLPGFSLMRDLSPKAQKLEELWKARRRITWLNTSNEFNERAIVQALTLKGAQDHEFCDWLDINCRAWLCNRADTVWPPEEGVAQQWLTEEQFMAGFPVGAHDRYVYALFQTFMAQS